MIPKELSHSTPEIRCRIEFQSRQIDPKSRQICSIHRFAALSFALGFYGLASCQLLAARIAAIILPFIRPYFNHEK
jgi:hypothetical protein